MVWKVFASWDWLIFKHVEKMTSTKGNGFLCKEIAHAKCNIIEKQ